MGRKSLSLWLVPGLYILTFWVRILEMTANSNGWAIERLLTYLFGALFLVFLGPVSVGISIRLIRHYARRRETESGAGVRMAAAIAELVISAMFTLSVFTGLVVIFLITRLGP